MVDEVYCLALDFDPATPETLVTGGTVGGVGEGTCEVDLLEGESERVAFVALVMHLGGELEMGGVFVRVVYERLACLLGAVLAEQ